LCWGLGLPCCFGGAVVRWLKPGVHDIDPVDYHADPCETPSLSAGLATKLVYGRPRHAWAGSPRLNPAYKSKDTTAFDIGSATHEIMTGKGGGIAIIHADNYQTKAAKEARDEARAEGLTPLTLPQHDQVLAMVSSLEAQLEVHPIGNPFLRGRKELTLIWDKDGVRNRCMVDCAVVEGRTAYDLKTLAGYADPYHWLRRSMDHGVDIRNAHYLEGLEAVFGGDWAYRFILIEKEDPHLMSVAQMTAATNIMGAKKLARARQIWKRCTERNEWPGYSQDIAEVEPPIFHETQWLERESQEADHRRRTGADILERALQWQAPEKETL